VQSPKATRISEESQKNLRSFQRLPPRESATVIIAQREGSSPALFAGKEAAMRTHRSGVRLLGVALALSPFAAGCASIFHGTRQKVEVFTDPPGATATAGDQQVTTPGVLKLPRKIKSTQIRIEKEGFTAKTVVLERRTSGLVWLNFIGIPAGFLGAGGAAASGSNDLSGVDRARSGAIVGGVGLPALGFLTDYGNGAAYRLEPARVVVRLDPVSVSASKQEP
jgi:hypothetical protein